MQSLHCVHSVQILGQFEVKSRHLYPPHPRTPNQCTLYYSQWKPGFKKMIIFIIPSVESMYAGQSCTLPAEKKILYAQKLQTPPKCCLA